jgi:hypothetical protein
MIKRLLPFALAAAAFLHGCEEAYPQITARTTRVRIPASGITNTVAVLEFDGGFTGTWNDSTGILAIYPPTGGGTAGAGIVNWRDGSGLFGSGSNITFKSSSPRLGVNGTLTGSSGTYTLGFDMSGLLSNGMPTSVTFSNDVTSTGTVTAGHFVGDGSQITGINYSQIAGTPSIAGGGTNIWLLASGGGLTNDTLNVKNNTPSLLTISLTTIGGIPSYGFTLNTGIITNNDTRALNFATSVTAPWFIGSGASLTSLNAGSLSGIIPMSNLNSGVGTTITINGGGTVGFSANAYTLYLSSSTIAGDVTGTLGSSTVGKIQNVSVATPTVALSMPYFNGSSILWTNPGALSASAVITNLPYVLEGWSAFPTANSTAYPAGANACEGLALADTNAAAQWVFNAPARWTGTNWTIRGLARFPTASSVTLTVAVQCTSYASGSTTDPTWGALPTQQLIFASSGTASNRVQLSYATTSILTNIQAGQDVYIRVQRTDTSGVLGWLKRLEILNQ